MRQSLKAILILCAGLFGCTTGIEPQIPTSNSVQYLGIETKLLEDDLVNIVAQMKGSGGNAMVGDYARCAAAQYAQIRGWGFSRHVRTQIVERAGNWVADAIYTISPRVPAGLHTINVDKTLAQCRARGIPTV